MTRLIVFVGRQTLRLLIVSFKGRKRFLGSGFLLGYILIAGRSHRAAKTQGKE